MTVSNHEVFRVDDDGQVVTLAMDSDPPLGNRTWAVVGMQLIDELTGKAPNGRISIQVEEPGPQPRIGADGFVGLVATPVHLFPNLKNQPYLLHLGIKVNGYLPMQFVPQVAQALNFPLEFVPANLGVIELHSHPTVLRGRVVQVSAAGVVTPLVAPVEVAGFWSKAPTPLVNPPASPPNMAAVFPPVYAGRSVAGGVIQRRDMVAVAGQDKTVMDFAAAVSQELVLSDRVGVVPGSLIWIDPTNADRMEIMEIATLNGSSNPQQPAQDPTRKLVRHRVLDLRGIGAELVEMPGRAKLAERPGH